MKQLPLELPFRQLAGRDDFIVSECNVLALASIDQWPNWRGNYRALNIVGPSGSGKSHLAAIWQSMVQNSHRLTGLAAGQRLPNSAFYVLDDVANSGLGMRRRCFTALTVVPARQVAFCCFRRCRWGKWTGSYPIYVRACVQSIWPKLICPTMIYYSRCLINILPIVK